MSRCRRTLFASVGFLLAPILGAAGQSSVAVSPFVSYIPNASSNPLAGFALTFGGTTGLALRSSAEISISNPDTASVLGHYRPWAGDADAMLFLGGLGGGATVFSRSLSPYVFSGIGLSGADSAGQNRVIHGWSYGLGALIPLGLHADLFAEARWRMSQYVLPTAKGAPDSKSALRAGLSFHVGGNEPRRAPPRRHRAGYYDENGDYVAQAAPAPVAPAPAPQVVVVQQPAAPPAQVVVVQQPAPAPAPVVVVQPERERRRSGVHVSVPIIINRPRGNRVYVDGSSCNRSRRSSRCASQRYEFELREPAPVARPMVVKPTAPVTRARTESARRRGQ